MSHDTYGGPDANAAMYVQANYPLVAGTSLDKVTLCAGLRRLTCPNQLCFNFRQIRFPQFGHHKYQCPCEWIPGSEGPVTTRQVLTHIPNSGSNHPGAAGGGANRSGNTTAKLSSIEVRNRRKDRIRQAAQPNTPNYPINAGGRSNGAEVTTSASYHHNVDYKGIEEAWNEVDKARLQLQQQRKHAYLRACTPPKLIRRDSSENKPGTVTDSHRSSRSGPTRVSREVNNQNSSHSNSNCTNLMPNEPKRPNCKERLEVKAEKVFFFFVFLFPQFVSHPFLCHNPKHTIEIPRHQAIQSVDKHANAAPVAEFSTGVSPVHEQRLRLRIYIPHKCCGAILGHRASIFKQIKQKSGVEKFRFDATNDKVDTNHSNHSNHTNHTNHPTNPQGL